MGYWSVKTVGTSEVKGQGAVCLSYHFLVSQWTDEEDQALREPIIKKFEAEGSPFYSSARYCSYCNS